LYRFSLPTYIAVTEPDWWSNHTVWLSGSSSINAPLSSSATISGLSISSHSVSDP
jgi:hypothetical protein